ncbi:MAG: hypothetical protein N3E49_05630 [Bacteroidia bacterium]|nr:hypothetical protein [Bacteroidia bacterium]
MDARILALSYLICWGCKSEKQRVLRWDFPQQQWIYPDTLWGELPITEPAACRTLELQIQLEELYPWRNLYLLAFLESPDGFRTQSRLELVFSDSLGRWYDSDRAFETVIAQRLSLGTAGVYRIGLLPYIRSDTVVGIRRIALHAYPCSSE